MAAPTQLQLSQYGVDAQDSRPLQYVSVGDSVLPPQLQYPSKTAEVEVIESPPMLHIHHPNLCSIYQRREDDDLIQLQFCVELKTMTITTCVLKTIEGLTGFVNPADHFVVGFRAAGEGTAQKKKKKKKKKMRPLEQEVYWPDVSGSQSDSPSETVADRGSGGT
ncbi:hypothetical protein SprV_0702330500 [Sparganum proliferum]